MTKDTNKIPPIGKYFLPRIELSLDNIPLLSDQWYPSRRMS